MSKQECYSHRHWIDLYRDHGELLRADNDESYPEYEGLDVIPGDEPATLHIDYKTYSQYHPTNFSGPGGWEHEVVLESIRLEVGVRPDLQVYELPQATMDAIWNECFDEINA